MTRISSFSSPRAFQPPSGLVIAGRQDLLAWMPLGACAVLVHSRVQVDSLIITSICTIRHIQVFHGYAILYKAMAPQHRGLSPLLVTAMSARFTTGLASSKASDNTRTISRSCCASRAATACIDSPAHYSLFSPQLPLKTDQLALAMKHASCRFHTLQKSCKSSLLFTRNSRPEKRDCDIARFPYTHR